MVDKWEKLVKVKLLLSSSNQTTISATTISATTSSQNQQNQQKRKNKAILVSEVDPHGPLGVEYEIEEKGIK